MYLVINSGSSSLKFSLFTKALKVRASGIVERIGLEKPFLSATLDGEKVKETYKEVKDHAVALKNVFAALKENGFDIKDIHAVGHRVVHGGEELTEPVIVNAAVIGRIRKHIRIAPLHNPANLAGILSCKTLLPWAKNVAMFDTGFYKGMPDFVYMYALPWELYKKHRIRRYGFHGISHQYVSQEAARQLKKPYRSLKIVSCHLGSGASITAVKNGKAFDTSMGFTPLEGLMMSTRCGDIDPAIPGYLMKELKMTPEEIDTLMNAKSGLLGVSGYKDLREVLTAAGHKVPGFSSKRRVSAERKYRAKLALDMFAFNVARYIGMYASIMGGVDAVLFTAGIGERSDTMRKMILKKVDLPWRPKIMVVPTDEELMIAKQTKRLVG